MGRLPLDDPPEELALAPLLLEPLVPLELAAPELDVPPEVLDELEEPLPMTASFEPVQATRRVPTRM